MCMQYPPPEDVLLDQCRRGLANGSGGFTPAAVDSTIAERPTTEAIENISSRNHHVALTYNKTSRRPKPAAPLWPIRPLQRNFPSPSQVVG